MFLHLSVIMKVNSGQGAYLSQSKPIMRVSIWQCSPWAAGAPNHGKHTHRGSAIMPCCTCYTVPHSRSVLLQEEFVSALVDTGVLKAAALAVRALQLAEEFPEVEPRYRQATVRQLLARGRWGVAIDFAQHDPGLQLEVRPPQAFAEDLKIFMMNVEGDCSELRTCSRP